MLIYLDVPIWQLNRVRVLRSNIDQFAQMHCKKLPYGSVWPYGHLHGHTDVCILMISFVSGKSENKKVRMDSLERNISDSGKVRKQENRTVYQVANNAPKA